MPAVGFEITISTGERPQTHALYRAATGTGLHRSSTNTKRVYYFVPIHRTIFDLAFSKICLTIGKTPEFFEFLNALCPSRTHAPFVHFSVMSVHALAMLLNRYTGRLEATRHGVNNFGARIPQTGSKIHCAQG